MTDETVERLELKLAFLERSNQELSDVVYGQQQQIDALRQQIREMADRLAAARDEPTQYSAEQERPPHY